MQFYSRAGFWVPPLMLVAMLGAGFFIKATELYKTEIRISQWLTENQTPVPSALSWLVAYGFSPLSAVIITLVIAFGIWLKRRNIDWLRFIFITLSGWSAAALIKPLVDRARPEATLLTNPIHPQNNFLSFPSGHTAFSVGLFSAIVLVLVSEHHRKIGFMIATIGVLTVGFARVYAGAHFPTDVIAGAISGSAGVWFAATLWQYWQAKHALENRSNDEQIGERPPKTGTLSSDGS
ncbi:MAG: phosphatase PAP2 family protein [Gleimia sp.]|jgi:membrane-associated phospholipid phosphatase